MALPDLLTPLFRRPLLCLTLLWVGGIVLASHLSIPLAAWLFSTAVFLVAWGVAVRCAPGVVAPVALGLAVLSLSAGFGAWRLTPPHPGDARYLPERSVAVAGYPLAPAQVTPFGWHTTFRVLSRREGRHWVAMRSDVYLSGRDARPQPGRYYQLYLRVLPAEDAGNPYGFSWASYLAERGLTYRAKGDGLCPLPGTAPAMPLGTLRAYCSRQLQSTMPGLYSGLHAQLLEGLILGVYGSPLPSQLVEQFRQAGTIHLMVVSGSQVALFAMLFVLPLFLLPYGRERTSYPRLRIMLLLLSLPVLGVYVVLADRGPSVDRALLMVLITALSLMLALSPLARRRSFRPDGLTLLALAALLMLIGNPALLFNPGMQLSFAAVFGLFTVTPVLLRLWPGLPNVCVLPFAATIGAQVMTCPVLAWHFGVIPLLAPLTNLIAVPLVGLLLPLGLLTLICAVSIPALATVLHWTCLPLLKLLLATNAAAAHCPWAQISCYIRAPWLILLYLAAVGSGMLLLSRWINSRQQGWDIPAGSTPRMW